MKIAAIQAIGLLLIQVKPFEIQIPTLFQLAHYLLITFENTWQYLVTFECDGNIVSFGDTIFYWRKVELDTS